MKRLVTSTVAARALGLHPNTLRRWETTGKLKPDVVTESGHRRYDLDRLRAELLDPKGEVRRSAVAYARVSSDKNRVELTRQAQSLADYCESQGWEYEVISDFGSGVNYRKAGLYRLLEGLVEGRFGRLVLERKDRLLRLGGELIFAICDIKDVEIVILNKGDDSSFDEELSEDMLDIVNVFTARLYSARSRYSASLMHKLRAATERP